MTLICLVKVVPDVEHFKYDYERNVLIRQHVPQILNPADVTALAFALDFKRDHPETSIQTVTMGPHSALPHIQDLIRRGVDRATLVSDAQFVGSDTYVTSRILARCLERCSYNWILSGTQTLDGGTAHVASQVAEILSIPQMSNIIEVDRERFGAQSARVDVDSDEAVYSFVVDGPALLSLQYATRLKLPYIPFELMEADVDNQIVIITNEQLGFAEGEVGLEGSLTQVARAEVRRFESKNTRFVGCDDAGIGEVYAFLREKGFMP